MTARSCAQVGWTTLLGVAIICGASLPAEEPFLPKEDGRLSEVDILNEIRSELGESLRPAALRRQAPQVKKSVSPYYEGRALVEVAGEKSVRAVFHLIRQPLTLVDTAGKQGLALESVAELRWKQWTRQRSLIGNNDYFLPTKCAVRLRNGQKLQGSCVPGQLLLLVAVAANGERRPMASYFKRAVQGSKKGRRTELDVVVQAPMGVVHRIVFSDETTPKKTASIERSLEAGPGQQPDNGGQP